MNRKSTGTTSGPGGHPGQFEPGPPVDWDSRYREGDTPWDKGRPHPGMERFWERMGLRGRGLVPGCGTGWDAIELARRLGRGGSVTGLDLSPRALRMARDRDLDGAVKWVEGDFFEMDEADLEGPYDWVFEHTCFCAIPPAARSRYFAAVCRWLRPGGLLAGFFFTGLEDDGRGPPWGVDAAALEALFEPAFESIAVDRSDPTFPGREGEETFRMWRYRGGPV